MVIFLQKDQGILNDTAVKSQVLCKHDILCIAFFFLVAELIVCPPYIYIVLYFHLLL